MFPKINRVGHRGIIPATVRIIMFFRINLFDDITYNAVPLMSWTIIEPSMYLIAACIPSLRPLVLFVSKKIGLHPIFVQLQRRASRTLTRRKGGGSRLASTQKGTTLSSQRSGFHRLGDFGHDPVGNGNRKLYTSTDIGVGSEHSNIAELETIGRDGRYQIRVHTDFTLTTEDMV